MNDEERSLPRSLAAAADRLRLCRRHKQVLKLTLRGLNVPAIAGHLQLAPSTIRTYMRRLCRDLGVDGPSELAGAVYDRLVEDEDRA